LKEQHQRVLSAARVHSAQWQAPTLARRCRQETIKRFCENEEIPAMPGNEQWQVGTDRPQYRIDARIRDLLMEDAPAAKLSPKDASLTLPEPVFPRHPELCGDVDPDPKFLPTKDKPYCSRITPFLLRRTLRGWLYPYLRSRTLPGDFHPIIAYLFTEYKCNLDCHYCWAFNNKVPGMTEDVARRSIDWLHDIGCRVLALMGGEVLIRPKFVHRISYYAARKGFWIYVPTNGRLRREDVIDRLGDAGIATVNLAVDSVEDREELPKALNPILPYFKYLIKKQYVHNFSVFFNINITRINIGDVKRLTEIARDSGNSMSKCFLSKSPGRPLLSPPITGKLASYGDYCT
jgi:sulfatase maturation enzyme AslB (radical SAM superfamily)